MPRSSHETKAPGILQRQTPPIQPLDSLYPKNGQRISSMSQSSPAKRLNGILGLDLVFPSPCHINVRSMAPPQTYLRSPAMSTNLPNLYVPAHVRSQSRSSYYTSLALPYSQAMDRPLCHRKGAMPAIQITDKTFSATRDKAG